MDELICISNLGNVKDITVNKSYQQIQMFELQDKKLMDNLVMIIDDTGKEALYIKEEFVTRKEWRTLQLNKLLTKQ